MMALGIRGPLSSMANVGGKRQTLVSWDPTLHGSDTGQQTLL